MDGTTTAPSDAVSATYGKRADYNLPAGQLDAGTGVRGTEAGITTNESPRSRAFGRFFLRFLYKRHDNPRFSGVVSKASLAARCHHEGRRAVLENIKQLLYIASDLHALAGWLIGALGLMALGEALLKDRGPVGRRALGHVSTATGGMVLWGTSVGIGLSVTAYLVARLFTPEPLGSLPDFTSHAWPWAAWMGAVWLIELVRSLRSGRKPGIPDWGAGPLN